MKKMLIISAVFALMTSCMPGLSTKLHEREVNESVYSMKDSPALYNPTLPLTPVTSSQVIHKGDSAYKYSQFYLSSKRTFYSLIEFKGQQYYTENKNFENETAYAVYQKPTTFKIPKQYDQTAWGRAIKFIQEYSDMKIQTQTELLIETYNPTQIGKRGFTVSKVPYGDYYEYTVYAINYDGRCQDCYTAHWFAKYITDFEY